MSEEREAAAVKLQCFFRALLAKKVYLDLLLRKMEAEAAQQREIDRLRDEQSKALIQAQEAKQAIDEKLAIRRNLNILRTHSATFIQRAYRDYRRRRHRRHQQRRRLPTHTLAGPPPTTAEEQPASPLPTATPHTRHSGSDLWQDVELTDEQSGGTGAGRHEPTTTSTTGGSSIRQRQPVRPSSSPARAVGLSRDDVGLTREALQELPQETLREKAADIQLETIMRARELACEFEERSELMCENSTLRQHIQNTINHLRDRRASAI
ncbi:unnamed protein product [Vitrella brassicaformis CCMP3155]|uniref:Uncharacterized protein n=2 Tax=Vitrella brassicaformis TaxID=1169539 RepID=A0A0G4EAC3_VITBC|nr:unnamed protein product [Vitrella brassicaformis CCMP3155]|eukprot:CEL92548.1 unnamed protein product [Vitrella brassicaformis CCMP3155]